MERIVVVSPPFLSHARPLAALAAALRENGAAVHFACAPDFAGLAHEAGVAFEPLVVTRNANTGVAEATRQESEEEARLAEFLDATRVSATAALLTQARHRRRDMLADPEGVLRGIAELHERVRPDWYVVDQLSYAVTLALHCLRLRHASFCPGHPSYVLSDDEAYFGVPYDWPRALRPSPQDRAAVLAAARANDRAFTALFEDFARVHAPTAPPPGRAFALTSPHAVVYAYPRLPWLPGPPPGPRALYTGHTVLAPAALDAGWRARVERLRGRYERVVLVALGTFLSARDDVLRAIVAGVLDGTKDTAVIAAAGGRSDRLHDLVGDRAVVEPVVPQQALLEHVDAMVHHGGNNSFTECVRAGVPALVLPFSSDQFAVARDAERAGVGVVADPNALAPGDVPAALDALAATRPAVTRLSREVRRRGPMWGARHLLDAMRERTARD
ncbi:glycosyltransferase [Streptomyces hilarionis]|uniref:glycosyltransferase n=1 Tax=Streptomyces hilarionis TaxID=2839954 RepID=UPI00211A2C20|nr:glycosyltransferase [Streptomyces hilarionis]MCQ9131649.1 glycosyltransferase [Streptomyces hilarionis]